VIRDSSWSHGLIACAAALLAGCTAFAHPIVGEDGSTLDQRLVGRWEGFYDEDEKIRVVIRPDGRVDVTFLDPDSKPETDTARWTTSKIDDLEIGNVGLEEKGTVYWKPVRYQLVRRGELHIYLCNDETWFGAVKSGALAGTAEEGHHGLSTFVSSAAADVRDFVRANRATIFVDDPVVLRRKR
jgi:hypothetical protein